MTIDVRDNAELRGEPFDLGLLDAPGVTETLYMAAALDLTFQLRVRTVGVNVVVRAEGSLDGREWYNLDAGDEDYEITADGVYALTYRGYVTYARLNWISESGSYPTIGVKALIGVIS